MVYSFSEIRHRWTSNILCIPKTSRVGRTKSGSILRERVGLRCYGLRFFEFYDSDVSGSVGLNHHLELLLRFSDPQAIAAWPRVGLLEAQGRFKVSPQNEMKGIERHDVQCDVSEEW